MHNFRHVRSSPPALVELDTGQRVLGEAATIRQLLLGPVPRLPERPKETSPILGYLG